MIIKLKIQSSLESKHVDFYLPLINLLLKYICKTSIVNIVKAALKRAIQKR